MADNPGSEGVTGESSPTNHVTSPEQTGNTCSVQSPDWLKTLQGLQPLLDLAKKLQTGDIPTPKGTPQPPQSTPPPPMKKKRVENQTTLITDSISDDEGEGESEGSEDDDLWADVDTSIPLLEERTLPPINAKLAKRMSVLWASTVPFKDVKDMMDEYSLRPANLENNKTPTLQKEIHNELRPNAKKNETKLVHCQQFLVCAANALASVADALLDAKHKNAAPDMKALITTVVKANGMIGQAHCAISDKRRFDLRNALTPEYRGICDKKIPTGQFLLSEDWQKELKEAKQTAQAVKDSIQPARFLGFSQRGRQHYRQPFPSFPSTSYSRQHQSAGRGRGRGGSKRYHPYRGLNKAKPINKA